ncbi:unnamed protein product [Euphydryas editha]|uniref:Integrase catalytic domain-containing protein n=1 Tax=Euphydryas editha TaxID=104508 RepID=A0AAU9TS08_EUPED|nr:unnamed protein product [Euphydryas editha]
MSSTGHNTFHIDTLVGRDNYATWKFAVEAYFKLEELWSCLDGTNVDKRKETKAHSKLILLLDPINYVHVQSATTCKEVWECLQQAFDDSGLYRKVALLRDLITTTLENSRDVDDYVTKIMSNAHKLRNINFNIDDEWLGTLKLADLPETYKPMIMGLESSGLVHQKTNSHTPEQNGLCERLNRTIVERARCLLFDAKLAKSLWAEAVNTAVYLRNRSPASGLSQMTPYERRTGKKPDLEHVRIFGSPAMVHVPKINRKKWDKKAVRYILVGYVEK